MDRRFLLSAATLGLATGFSRWRASATGTRRLVGYIRTNWSKDPYAFGSYSYIARGARRRDIRALEAPVGDRLFFAGEATFPTYNSTVHAAYESGRRVADFVLDGPARRVAIVGAGMSGLSAARRLGRSGLDVTVFEARDRIGGRVWTDERLGFPLDLGASWIHGNQGNPLIPLADAAGQRRIETSDRYLIRGRGGRLLDEDDAPNWLEQVVSVQHSAGADIKQINRLAYLFDQDYGGSDLIFPEGYAGIFKALSGDYAVRLSEPVLGVNSAPKGVALEMTSGEVQSFDAVIVTAPLGVLKRGGILFTPSLPPAKRQAIERLGMGVLDKVYLLFDEPFWDAGADWIATPANGLPRGHFNQWLNLHKYLDRPVIMAFNGGPPALALASLADEDIVERALNTLERAYPSS